MNNHYIETREETPIFKTKKCKMAAYIVYILLKYTSIIIAFLFWYLYDYFIAAITFMLTFIIMGIIQSKLRNYSIPLSQHEFQYSDSDTSKWIAKNLFCK